MAHLPVNHPGRAVYRVVAAVVGLYILLFGVVGLFETWGQSFFDRGEHWVLGLQTNPAFSVLSILAGAVVFGGACYGHNVDHFINLWGSIIFLVAGIVMMTLLRTEANLLNFALINCLVSFVVGVALLLAGLYGKEGPPELQEAEDQLRHGDLSEAHLATPVRDAGAGAGDHEVDDASARRS